MLTNILSVLMLISVIVFLKVFSMLINQINEEITDMEIQITDLEVENIKLENKIKTISQNLKQKI